MDSSNLPYADFGHTEESNTEESGIEETDTEEFEPLVSARARRQR